MIEIDIELHDIISILELYDRSSRSLSIVLIDFLIILVFIV